MIRIGSTFSGIDGLALGVQFETLGRVVWHSEIDRDGARVLARHWHAPNHGDITTVDWGRVEPIDILVGGSPCQDISLAGKGAGIDGERSGLWREYVRCLRALRPKLAFLENVAALLVRGFGRVARDLAESGYRFAWSCYSSAAIGAPHKRERVFLLATPDGAGVRRAGEGLIFGQWRELGETRGEAADSDGARLEGRDERGSEQRDSLGLAANARRGGRAPDWLAADADRAGLRLESGRVCRADGSGAREPVDDGSPIEHAAPAHGHVDGLPSRRARARKQPRNDADGRGTGGGMAAEVPARDPGVGGDHREASAAARRLKLNPDFVEWMMGFPPGWTAGVSRRARLRLLGNAVQPQVAAEAFLGLRERLEVAA